LIAALNEDVGVVIVAGGMGTRMAPLLHGRPKILAGGVGSDSFLRLQLGCLASQGIRRVHLCLGAGAEQVVRALADATPTGMQVTTSIESRALGVIGALVLAAPALDERFVMVYGDVLPRTCIPAAVRAFDATAARVLMAVWANGSRGEPSNVALVGERVVRYSKASDSELTHLDVGVWVLARRAILEVPQDRLVTEEEFLSQVIRARMVYAFQCDRPNPHIGDPAHYEWFCRLVAAGALA
jgi:NDP-sugar pyrophosphorylase family protein